DRSHPQAREIYAMLEKMSWESSGPNAGFKTFSVRVRRRLPDFLHSVNLRHVKLGYHYLIRNALYFFVVPLLLVLFSAEVGTLRRNNLWSSWEKPTFDVVSLLSVSGL
ncbi:hypothetical protein KI387_027376, partial [Taxus chinensis]